MRSEPVLRVAFYRLDSDREPVRSWIRGLAEEDQKRLGDDIRTVQYRWPLGMPLVRKLDADLWEIRSHLTGGQIARVFFTVRGKYMVLLHAFEKKSDKTPRAEIDLARTRRKGLRHE